MTSVNSNAVCVFSSSSRLTSLGGGCISSNIFSHPLYLIFSFLCRLLNAKKTITKWNFYVFICWLQRYYPVFTQRFPLIRQWSTLLCVYNYKAISLSVMQHIIVYHGLLNFEMIILSWQIHLVLLVCQGLCFSSLPWWPVQLIPCPYKQTAEPVLFNLFIFKR